MSAQEQLYSNTAEIYKKISKHVPEIEWKVHAPLIEKINKLKKEVLFAGHEEAKKLYDAGEYFNKKTLDLFRN